MNIGLKPIIPKKNIFDTSKIKAQIENALDNGAIIVQSQLEKNTETWNHSVRFLISASDGKRTIETDDEIYGYVTNGTRAHVIRAKRKNLGFYRTGFQSKTRPGALGSRNGARATENFIRAKSVVHPGTQARNFEYLTVKKWEKKIIQLLEQAMKTL